VALGPVGASRISVCRCSQAEATCVARFYQADAGTSPASRTWTRRSMSSWIAPMDCLPTRSSDSQSTSAWRGVADLDPNRPSFMKTGSAGPGAQQGWCGRVGVLADRVSPAAPRLLAGRTGGPVFLGGHRPTRAIAGLDLDPTSGRARLSYRRAAELFRVHTGWTLHQLRHSALTHAAEDGTNLPLLLARSRHASVRSLER
jgi:hypothetical protein